MRSFLMLSVILGPLFLVDSACAQNLYARYHDLLYSTLAQPNTTINILSGPTADYMNRGTYGQQWLVEGFGQEFKITIEDGTGTAVQTVADTLQALPEPYFSAYVEVSEPDEDGVAVYLDLDGAWAHGGQDYLNFVPDAIVHATVVAHEAGHALEQMATENNPWVPTQWQIAIANDPISVSAYGDSYWAEDVAEFSMIYSLCTDGGQAYLDELQSLSPMRFDLWERILFDSNGFPTWDHNGGGLWNQASNWNGGVPVSGDSAFLSSAPSTPATVTFNSSVTLNHLMIDNTSKYTIAGSRSLTLTDSAEVRTLSGSHEIAVPVAGNSGLTKRGIGTLILSTAATFSGDTNVEEGTLKLTGSASIANSTNISVHPGTTLDVSGLSSSFTLAGGQTLNNDSNSTVLGNTTASSGSTVSGAGTFANNLTAMDGSVVQVGGAGLPNTLSLTNGDFETGGGENITDVTDWYDDNTGAGFWDGAWQTNADWITTPPNNVVVFSGNDIPSQPSADVNVGSYLYQSIGTAGGVTSLQLAFDWGAPGDDPGARELGMTVAVYAYDGLGGFNAADDVDLYGATGITLLDSASYAMTTVGGSQIDSVLATLDLTGAGTQELFLRFNNYAPAGNAGDGGVWPILDNVEFNWESPILIGETMTVAGDVSLQAGATVTFDVATSGVNDLLDVAGHLDAAGTLEVLLDGSAPALSLGDNFDLLDFTTASGGFDSFALPSLGSGLVWKVSNLLATGELSVVVDVDLDDNGWITGTDFLLIQQTDPSLIAQWQTLYGSQVVAGTSALPAGAAVPEPSTAWLMGMAGILGWWNTRRRSECRR